jgi:two-component system NtrC family sensor kinase
MKPMRGQEVGLLEETQAGPDAEMSASEELPPPKVLVVDDTQANLKLLKAILEPLACDVVLASTGREALSLTELDEFAVLLLDVQMPEMDGYALSQSVRLKAKTKDVPIIFLTASSFDDDNVLRGYVSGAVDFLFKPLNATILRSKVRVFLELYASQRRAVEAKRALERAYDELKTTQAQLVQSAKMASLGELVAGIAHEINNPLAFALSHIGTASRSLEKLEELSGPSLSIEGRAAWDRATTRLRETGIGLERIRDLVVKLRTFSRLDDGERQPANIRECVESVLMILTYRLKDRIEVETHFGPPDVIECYPGLLNQAILNILANSVDAIEGAGKITIVTGERADGYELSFQDSGPGIPAKLRDRVLEPFFTTKPVGQGTGLGLSICYSIVRKHRGSLVVDCPETGGTRVTILLPQLRR